MSRPDARELDVVRAWCRQRGDGLEVVAATNVLTIRSHDPHADIARLPFDPQEGTWRLFQIDGSKAHGFRRFEWAEPSTEVDTLLDVVDEDPTGVFWG